MRILLFIGTNLAILFVLNIVLQLFGVGHWLSQSGSELNITGLLIISAVIGMAGSFISLVLSKYIAKRSMGVAVVEIPKNNNERFLRKVVLEQSERVGITMPEIGIFPSRQPNAFATGLSRNNSLVAVSQGLLDTMDADEVEAVIGHEISHIANGDMITLTLIQGVVNTFVIFLSRIIGHIVDRVILKSRGGFGIGYFATVIISQMVLAVLASTIVMWFSRRREFRADYGGAKLAGRNKMIAALKRLQQHSQVDLPREMAAFGISGYSRGGLRKLFMSHPPLEQRIAALEKLEI